MHSRLKSILYKAKIRFFSIFQTERSHIGDKIPTYCKILRTFFKIDKNIYIDVKVL